MYLTVADVCERLECSASTVYRLVHGGHLRAYKRPGRTGTLRFTEDDLKNHLAGCVVGVKVEPSTVGDHH